MGIEQYVPLIGSLGFPIVAYFLMFTKFDKTIGKLSEQINVNNQLVQLLLQKEGVKVNE